MRPFALLVVLGLSLMAMAAEEAPATYRGRPVSKAWVDQQYTFFANKIAVVGDKYYDVGRGLLEKKSVTNTPPEIGGVRMPPLMLNPKIESKVFQVLKDDQVLVEAKIPARVESIFGGGTVMFRVTGVDTANLTDGAPFRGTLIYTGRYTYVSAGGARSTVQSYMLHKPITKEQFVQAISSGLVLTRWREVKKTVTVGNIQGGGFSVQSFTSKETVTEIVGAPVP